MDILKLRYFLVVARCQNMTKAAEALHVAQPAISQAIKKLDDELGVKLFDRVGRNIRLSETGKLFYTEIEPLVKALDDIPQKLADKVGLENKTVRVNILASHELMTDIVSEFKREHLDASFHISQNEEDENWDIRISPVFDKDYSGHEETVLSEEIFVAVPVDSHLCDLQNITFEDIRHAGFISLERNRQFSTMMASHCLSAGFEPLIVYEGESPDMVAKLVGAGVGLAFWPEYSWGKIHDDRVKLIRVEEGACRWNLYLARKDQMGKTEMKDEFYDFAVNYIHGLPAR